MALYVPNIYCIFNYNLNNVKELKKLMHENNFPGQFYTLECDLVNENDILKSFKWIDENIGAIHFMINNAGIIRINTITGKVDIFYARYTYIFIYFRF